MLGPKSQKIYGENTMKKTLLLVALLTSQLFGAAAPVPSTFGYELNRSGALARKYSLGTAVVNGNQFGMRGMWKFSDQGGAASTNLKLHDSEGLNVTLPAGAVVTHCYIDTPVLVTSATSSGKVSFSASGIGDLKAATFIGTFANQASTINSANGASSKPLACIPDGTATNMIRLASEGSLQISIGSEALTGGQVDVWVEYILSGSL